MLWLGPKSSLVLLAAPWGRLGWAEVLAGIYVFYYSCYFFHWSNKSALWETPSDSIRSTEIGFSHLCSPGHCCPKRWIRVPRRRLQWCTACILGTGLSAHLGIFSAILLLSKYPQVSPLSLMLLYTLILLCYLQKGGVQGKTLKQQIFLFASFLLQLSKAILACFSALIIPPSATAPLLCRKAPHGAHVLWAGKGWLFFMTVSWSTLLGCYFHQGTGLHVLDRFMFWFCWSFFWEGEYLKTVKLLFTSVDFLSIANVLFPIMCRCLLGRWDACKA